MAAAALGLRAIPSDAPATARPCPRPHKPDAIAIPIPAPRYFAQSEDPAGAAPGACAKANELANNSNASNTKNFFVIVLSSLRIAHRRWFHGVLGSRRAHTGGRH